MKGLMISALAKVLCGELMTSSVCKAMQVMGLSPTSDRRNPQKNAKRAIKPSLAVHSAPK